MRTIVYVDGFNLYYGQLKGRGNKWLDLKALSSQLLKPKHRITCIKYFTAHVSGAIDQDAPRRQKVYLNALSTIPEVEIHLGNFLAKTIWRPLINFPVGNETISAHIEVVFPIGNYPVTGKKPSTVPVNVYPNGPRNKGRPTARPLSNATIAEVHTMEEKGSDVNLAAHLVNDACGNHFDVALVISNDTDLVTPIRMAVSKGKTVIVGCPSQDGVSSKLKQASTYCMHIRPAMVRRAQLPNPIPGTTITKPATW